MQRKAPPPSKIHISRAAAAFGGAAGQAQNGIAVSKSQLQPGDIILFGSASNINHAGIYAGNGMFIHSPQTGDVVKYTALNSGYYANRFVCARRIIY